MFEPIQVGPRSVQSGVPQGVEIALGLEETGEIEVRAVEPDQFGDEGGATGGEAGFRR